MLPRSDCPSKLSVQARRTFGRELSKRPARALNKSRSSMAEIGDPIRHQQYHQPFTDPAPIGRWAQRIHFLERLKGTP